ncbi:hypothetical protein PsYK624_118370 [Phanerochaete sordida]|uniref:Uncharacterized protein n=1 Tax=Phanerochaete sordida TaxID=48140 RepID=A0A9P3LHL0_9APHY|nr:hypothetical protein PsYK624_118370 [Phanerochaete sordida]
MLYRQPVLPPEIVHAIVSRVVVRHLDDVLVGPMSALNAPHVDGSDVETGGPVAALLVVSCQFRQATIMILANALDIAISRAGVWRLLEKPLEKIEPVRDFLAARVVHDGVPEHIIDFVLTAKIERSPVLSVYAHLHVFEETTANPFPPISVPNAEGEDHLTLTLEVVYDFYESRLREKYDECPSVFQDLFHARMEGVFARCTATLVYDNLMKLMEESWGKIYELSANILGDPLLISGDELEIHITSLTSSIRHLPEHEQLLRSTWTYSMSVDAAIGESRFEDWILLFSIIARWTSRCKSMPELLKAAQDAEDAFRARLARLRGEDVPRDSDHRAVLSQEVAGGSSEGTAMLEST